MDYFIIAIITVAGLAFHWWIFVLIRRWSQRDLALSLAGKDPIKQAFMLEKLAEAQRLKVRRKELDAWLEAASQRYDAQAAGTASST
ncbi:hypothetical protein SAMN05216421_0890 [Halopseudomonas xinjiangensis]|uniref:30S ribosomal protein S3 n=1 Tax=Halopseudomonas xinjiangensis TaxID=487184 RepID=A0A1H1PCX7_9GAMM|nr:hypothetical protein [Halopseudomonas xinjiangensis]SDS09126.1 hypothetical protein SAMN05216421_0890 [Halopseudomonas xinjiangensis]